MFDIVSLIKTVGLLGIFFIVFAESGLLIGFFLPGDSLLFTAGLLASQGWLDIYWLVIGSFLAAVIGDSVGYAFGKKFGTKVFAKPKSLLWQPEHIERAQKFFTLHGGKTIILARFIPFIRTFAPILAGVGKMNYGYFFSYNIIGALLWAVGVTLAGYYLGNLIPGIEQYLWPIVILIILTSLIPLAKDLIKHPEHRHQVKQKLINLLKRNISI